MHTVFENHFPYDTKNYVASLTRNITEIK